MKSIMTNIIMKKKIIRKMLTGVILLLVCGLVLAGCGEDKGAGGDMGKTAGQPVMLDYEGAQSGYFGIINSEGTMIVPLAERDRDSVVVLSTQDRRQCYAMEVEYILPEGESLETAVYGNSYRIVGKIFRFYDPWGKLVHEQEIRLPNIAEGNQIEFWLAKDGSLENSRFLLSTFAGDGGYHILDINGVELAAKEIYDVNEPLRYAYAFLCMDEEIMIVNYDCAFEATDEATDEATGEAADEEQANIEGAEFYSLSGEPMTMERDYLSCWQGWDIPSQQFGEFFIARYMNDDTYSYLYDVLDKSGQVVLSGLDRVDSFCGNSSVLARRGDVQGLLTLEGEWLYQEKIEPVG